LMRPDTESVHDDQAQGASDGRVRPVARAEDVISTVETEPRADRPVYDDDLRLAGFALKQPAYSPAPAREADNKTKKAGKVLRPAPRHDGVNRRLPHCAC